MSHHIYQTKGFVIDTLAVGEANMVFGILTEDLGLVRAVAQGVRLQKSKLKPSLQKYSYSEVCLVKGKEVWRVTNANKIISLYDKRLSYYSKKTLAMVISFLQRMIVGEGKNADLFEVIQDISSFCFKNSKYINNQNMNIVYKISQFKILNAIGYGLDKNNDIYDYFVKKISTDLIESLNNSSKSHLSLMEKHIEDALSQSHL